MRIEYILHVLRCGKRWDDPMKVTIFLFAGAVLLGACASIPSYEPGAGDAATTCVEGQWRCVGQSYQWCSYGQFKEVLLCPESEVCA
ncbi:MAG: hypothetical protein V1754_08380 [Pseudomonadota bacterium]